MAPKSTPRRLVVSIALLVLFGAAFVPHSVSAAQPADTPALPDLTTFTASVVDGKASVVVGAYVDGLFALPVLHSSSISRSNETLTQYGMAQTYGVVGLLAHNYLSGQYFTWLTAGRRFYLIYGDGRQEAYRVTQVLSYRATEPLSAYSNLVDLDTGEQLSAEGLFRKVYMGTKHVTFQTCIAKDGQSSWGRLFVIAELEASLGDASGALEGTSALSIALRESLPTAGASRLAAF
jgi:hypothetical protein